MTYTRKLYFTGSATGNSLASQIIPSRSRLVGVQWGVWFDCVTDNASFVLEVSRSSATEIAVAGAQQCITEIAFRQNFVTSGLAPGMVNLWIPTDVPFEQGQIVYLHGVVVGTITATGGAVLWLS
jgi:hypothetical protein